MALAHLALPDVTVADLQQLVDDGVSESRQLDYKQELPDLKDLKAKKEFLYDVSAMANAGGGDILFGVREERVNGKPSGRPHSLDGVMIPNPDGLVLALENLIRDGISPRIPSREILPIKIGDSRYVVVVRVGRSLSAPHMVVIDGGQRFYTRNSAGKHPMDVSELRGAFLASSGFVEQVKQWRAERLSLLRLNEGCLPLRAHPKVVVHLMPLTSTDPTTLLSVAQLKEEATNLLPLSSGGTRRVNFDGFMMCSKESHNTDSYAYVEFFRTGQIESIDTEILNDDGQNKFIPSVFFEDRIIHRTGKYLRALRNNGIEPPIAIGLALLGVKGFIMGHEYYWDKWPITHEDVVTPLVLAEDWQKDVDQIMCPLIDCVWNATGYDSSPNFDEAGHWTKHS